MLLVNYCVPLHITVAVLFTLCTSATSPNDDPSFISPRIVICLFPTMLSPTLYQTWQPSCGKPQEAYRPGITCPSVTDLAGGVPHPVLAGGVPHPDPIMGYPPARTGVPPGRDLKPVTGVPPERTWDQWKYYGMEMGYPQKGHWTSGSIMGWRWGKPSPPPHTPPSGGQTENITSRRTTYVGDNNEIPKLPISVADEVSGVADSLSWAHFLHAVLG